MSVNKDEIFAVVEDVSSSKGGFFIHVAGVGVFMVLLDPLYLLVEKMERSEEETSAATLEQVRNESVYVASNFIVRSSVPSRDVDKDEEHVPLPQKSATVVDGIEGEEYEDVVESSSPVCAGVQSEGFTFQEAVRIALLET